MKKAIVYFADGTKSVVRVNSSYSKGGIHAYHLTLNALDSWLDWAPGKSEVYTGDQISKLTYIMG
jgi:hypothetical protein